MTAINPSFACYSVSANAFVTVFAMFSTCAAFAQQDSELDPWDATVKYQSMDAPAESSQFDFAIGEWDAQAKRYNPLTGAVVSEVRVLVTEEYRNDERLILSEWTDPTFMSSPHASDK